MSFDVLDEIVWRRRREPFAGPGDVARRNKLAASPSSWSVRWPEIEQALLGAG
jgi:hypothetical protein